MHFREAMNVKSTLNVFVKIVVAAGCIILSSITYYLHPISLEYHGHTDNFYEMSKYELPEHKLGSESHLESFIQKQDFAKSENIGPENRKLPDLMIKNRKSRISKVGNSQLNYLQPEITKSGTTDKGIAQIQNIKPTIRSTGTTKLVFSDMNSKEVIEKRTIEKHNYIYLHRPRDKCQLGVELVICVPSIPADTSSRHRLRQQRHVFITHYNATLVFFLGVNETDENKSKQKIIDKEALQFNDIVQENFIDTYRNLSIKSISIAKWVSHFCSSALFVIKSDSDVFIRPLNLLRAMRRQLITNKLFIIGNLRGPQPPNRNPKSKWYISFREYQGFYPRFVSGPTYGYTVTAARLIYQASLEIPFFPFEDVFIGMCAQKKSIPIVRDALFTYIH